MGDCSLLEMSIDFLNQRRFELECRICDQHLVGSLHNQFGGLLTWTCSMHNLVIASTLAPDTPGGLRACKACRWPSMSSTAGMITVLLRKSEMGEPGRARSRQRQREAEILL